MRTAAILFALVAMTSAAHAAQPAASASTNREVITVDSGPGRRLTIVRDADGAGPTASAQRPQVLAYKDRSGVWVRAYADHPVSRVEVEAQVLAAEGRAEQARSQGRLAAEAGRRAAAEGRRIATEGRRMAQTVRQDAAATREAGLRAAQEGGREAELGRREAERARAESEQAIREARRETEQLRPNWSSDRP